MNERKYEVTIGPELMMLGVFIVFMLLGPTFCGDCRQACDCGDRPNPPIVPEKTVQKEHTSSSSVSVSTSAVTKDGIFSLLDG